MEQVLEPFRRCFFFLLRHSGHVPEHVAFIMDGNRRFAEEQRIQRRLGHEQGYSKFVEVVRWCLELGVQWITVYAFSIENFKRSHDEVEELMTLAQEKYEELLQDSALSDRYGVEVRIIGDVSLAKESVQRAAARVMQKTQEGVQTAVVNICFSYTASQEICRGVSVCRSHLEGPTNEQTLRKFLFTEDCPDVDLVVRTSGETRLSDFLLVQVRRATIVFDTALWPDFSLLNFAKAILIYSQSYGQGRSKHQASNEDEQNVDGSVGSSHPSIAITSGADKDEQQTSLSQHFNDKTQIQFPRNLLQILRSLKQTWIKKYSS